MNATIKKKIKRLDDLRRAQRYSFGQVGEMLGVSNQTVSNWVKGRVLVPESSHGAIDQVISKLEAEGKATPEKYVSFTRPLCDALIEAFYELGKMNPEAIEEIERACGISTLFRKISHKEPGARVKAVQMGAFVCPP